MIPLSPTLIGATALLVALAGLTGAVSLQTHRLHAAQADLATEKANYAAFVRRTKQIGDEQEAKAKSVDLANKQRQEAANAENSKSRRNLADLYAAYGKLRDSRAGSGSGLVPGAAPGSASPATASFDRAALDRALSGFDRGATGLLSEGDQAIADLNTAKDWAQSR